MNDRLRNLLSVGRLQELPAPDEEIRGLWKNALAMLADAELEQRATPLRLASAYDAGRMVAHTIVRANGYIVKAANHHELTLSVAGILAGNEIDTLIARLQVVRLRRSEVEYGWRQSISEGDMLDALECARAMAREAEEYLGRVGRDIE